MIYGAAKGIEKRMWASHEGVFRALEASAWWGQGKQWCHFQSEAGFNEE